MTKDNMNIKFESMLSKHQEFLWKMLYQTLFVPNGDKPFPQGIIHHPDLSKYAKNWGNKNDIGLIAIDGQTNEKIGAAWLRLFTKENRGYGYVDNDTPELAMAVLKTYRGKGIGSMLLKELINEATKKYNAISLSVEVTNNPAMKLYKSFGFKTSTRIVDSLTMIKVIK